MVAEANARRKSKPRNPFDFARSSNGADERTELHESHWPAVNGLTNAEAAEAYAKSGIPVVPVPPGTKNPVLACGSSQHSHLKVSTKISYCATLPVSNQPTSVTASITADSASGWVTAGTPTVDGPPWRSWCPRHRSRSMETRTL